MAITKIDDFHKNEKVWENIKRVVNSLEYGSVMITVHNGKIVQIDTTSKQRL